MQKTKIEKGVDKAPERFKLGEMGFTGLRISHGVSADELDRDLNFPNNLKTFKKMTEHSTINGSLNFFSVIISKASWKYNPPDKASAEEIKQAETINQMMNDMEHSWSEFVTDALSNMIYGFSIHEKVYRRRYKSNGSKYDDGLIGWKKLAIRSQESIEKFVFSDDGNDIIGVKQNISRIADAYNQYGNRATNEVVIPYSKVLHFRTGRHRGDPYGKSPLRDAYLAWKYLTYLEDLEATGVAKDLIGLPVLYLPPQYLSADAGDSEKAIRAYYENCLRNLQMNEQSAMILPQMYDPETKQPLFELELLSVDGKKSYDIGKIKEWYKNMIMISLSTDILTMGQSAVGSFALGSIKNSLAGTVAMSFAAHIADVLNRSLIRQTYELNGWDVSRMGTMDIDQLVEVDLESLSKYWQRVASVGLVEVDREVLNVVRAAGGADAKPIDAPVDKEALSGNQSKAGEGMKTAGEGTSKFPSGKDSSSSNADNSA